VVERGEKKSKNDAREGGKDETKAGHRAFVWLRSGEETKQTAKGRSVDDAVQKLKRKNPAETVSKLDDA